MHELATKMLEQTITLLMISEMTQTLQTFVGDYKHTKMWLQSQVDKLKTNEDHNLSQQLRRYDSTDMHSGDRKIPEKQERKSDDERKVIELQNKLIDYMER